MSIWDKDKAFAPDGQLNEFAPAGTKFVLYSAEMIDPIFDTDIGTAPMVHLTVADLQSPDDKKVVSTIGDTNATKFFDKDSDWKSKVDDGDLPAIVETRNVPSKQESFSDAFVIRFIDIGSPAIIKKYAKEDKHPL